jgi:hypothetical protein
MRSARFVGLQFGDGGGELHTPGPERHEAQPQAASAVDEPGDGEEELQAQAFGCPGADGAVKGRASASRSVAR